MMPAPGHNTVTDYPECEVSLPAPSMARVPRQASSAQSRVRGRLAGEQRPSSSSSSSCSFSLSPGTRLSTGVADCSRPRLEKLSCQHNYYDYNSGDII